MNVEMNKQMSILKNNWILIKGMLHLLYRVEQWFHLSYSEFILVYHLNYNSKIVNIIILSFIPKA